LIPSGINYVIVNGEVAVKDKVRINDRLGKVIRKNDLKKWRE